MRARSLIALATSAALAVAVLPGCVSAPAPYAARVVDDVVMLQIPAIPMPSPDPDAGFVTSGSPGAPAARARVTTVAAITGLGSASRVASVAVRVGDEVAAGQLVAVLDTAALDADVAVARANERAARAQIGLLDANLGTLADARAKLSDARAKLDSTEAQLRSTRAQLAEKLAQLEAVLAKLPPALPPGGIPGMPDPAALRAAAAKLSAGIARIDAGLAKLEAGRAKLSSARAKLADARSTLRGLRAVVVAAADAAPVAVEVARYRRSLAEIRSPYAGRVVALAQVGAQLYPGATVASIRRERATRVTTWVTPEVAARLAVGDGIETRSDGGEATRARGTIVRIGANAQYPPTSLATQEVHLTRAVQIEAELASGAAGYSPGSPVDLWIR